MSSPSSAEKPAVSLATLMNVFFRVGMASFGGATAAFLYREIVQMRRWMSEEEFLAALTLSQVMPGANPVNMALYVGSQLRGGMGGFVAVLGLVGPPFVVILILGVLYTTYGGSPVVQAALAGIVAIGVAMVLQLGVQLARNIRRLVPAAIALVIFVVVGVLNWPMIPVVLVLAPLSVGFELYTNRKAGDG
jgi:chromate transporter